MSCCSSSPTWWARKLTAFGPFRVSGAQLLFPLTYIFSDIFTEVYGYAGSRRAIWIAFFANVLMALMGLFMVWIPAAPEWPGAHQEAFRIVFGPVPRMISRASSPSGPGSSSIPTSWPR